MKTRTFTLIYAPMVRQHLKSIEVKYHPLIRQTIEERLQIDADRETQNRKPLKRSIGDANWELRFGPDNRFRVLYKIGQDEKQVAILAIGEKKGERLSIGRKEIKL